MASDGSQYWESGGSFGHLPQHIRPPPATSYAAERNAAHAKDENHQQRPQQLESDRTGVWNGPAPRGEAAPPRHVQDQPSMAAATKQPQSVVLPGGGRMPLIGLGTYKLDSTAAVHTALEAGYRHIDCASIYGNEELVGEGLRDFIQQGHRDELFIVSKVWNDAHRADSVRASAERSVAALGCGRLDLLLMHWPVAWRPGTEEIDEGVTLRDTWQALETCVDAGLTRYIGVSNFNLSQLEDLLTYARIKPVVNQVELHPLNAQRKLVGSALRLGVHSVGYSPLGHSKTDLLEHPAVVAVAEEVGRTPAQVLLRWCVQRGVAAIPKAGSPPHVRENIEGLFDWALTYDQKAKIDALDRGYRLVKPIAGHVFEDPEQGGVAKPSVVLGSGAAAAPPQ